jgi:hypothetical protein
VQEVGFPTRNDVEAAAGRSAQVHRGRLGCLLSRARDGVPQAGLVTLLCAERGRRFVLRVGVADGKETVTELFDRTKIVVWGNFRVGDKPAAK